MVIHKSSNIVSASVSQPFLQLFLRSINDQTQELQPHFREFTQVAINNTPISAIDMYRIIHQSRMDINFVSSCSDGSRRVNLITSGTIRFTQPDPVLGEFDLEKVYQIEQYFNLATCKEQSWIQSYLVIIH
jgi:hypothetical protein